MQTRIYVEKHDGKDLEKHDGKENSQGDASTKTVETALAKMTYASAVRKQNTSVINDRRRGSSEERSEEH